MKHLLFLLLTGSAFAADPTTSDVCIYVDEKGVLHRERGFFVGGFSAFPISYRSLRPRAGECDNLLAISCLSASHAAYGSVRMEPVFMMLGHAAGAAAVIAVDGGFTVQDVPYALLKERLLAEKQILERNATRVASDGTGVHGDESISGDCGLLCHRRQTSRARREL